MTPSSGVVYLKPPMLNRTLCSEVERMVYPEDLRGKDVELPTQTNWSRLKRVCRGRWTWSLTVSLATFKGLFGIDSSIPERVMFIRVLQFYSSLQDGSSLLFDLFISQDSLDYSLRRGYFLLTLRFAPDPFPPF